MKYNKFKIISAASMLLLAVGCNTSDNANSEKDSKSGIEYVYTSQGKFPLDAKGFPEQETVTALADEIDYQKAIQAYMWGMPQMVTAGQHNQAKFYGAKENTDFLKIYKDPALLGILTPNNLVEYLYNFNNYAETGPMVLEMPGGKLVGLVMDYQMRWSADIGLVGPKGAGPEKLLFLRTNDPIPEGINIDEYRVERVSTNVGFMAIRVLDPVKDPELDKDIKWYPYSERANPKANNLFQAKQDDEIYFISAPKGMTYWKQLHAFIQQEDVREVDRFFMSHLRELGIEKDKEFNPTERQIALLERAAFVGEKMAITKSFNPTSPESVYRDDSNWSIVLTLNPDHKTKYTEQFTERVDWFWEAYGASPSMMAKVPGKGSTYLGAYKDDDNNWLDGSKNYQVTLAPNVPAAQFWDYTAYNLESRSILQNQGGKTAVNSFTEGLQTNDNGSVTIYFGPKAETGKESNWIQTNPDEYWFAYFRLYAPTETYFDRSWPVYNIELVE